MTEGSVHAGLGLYHRAESSALKILEVGNSKAWWHTAVVLCKVLGWSSLWSLSGLTWRTVLKWLEVLGVCSLHWGCFPRSTASESVAFSAVAGPAGNCTRPCTLGPTIHKAVLYLRV